MTMENKAQRWANDAAKARQVANEKSRQQPSSLTLKFPPGASEIRVSVNMDGNPVFSFQGIDSSRPSLANPEAEALVKWAYDLIDLFEAPPPARPDQGKRP